MTAQSTRMAEHNPRTQRLRPEKAIPLAECPAPQPYLHNDTVYEMGGLGPIAGMLAQIGLPHGDPGGIAGHTAVIGDFLITVGSSVPDGGIPWGIVPRLLLAYVGSRAMLAKSPVVHLDQNKLSKFLRDELGMDVSGDPFGILASAREQAYRLFTSTIVVTQRRTEMGGTRTTIRMISIARLLAIWEPRGGNTPHERWRFKITLSEEFYKSLGDPIPLFGTVPAGEQTKVAAYLGVVKDAPGTPPPYR